MIKKEHVQKVIALFILFHWGNYMFVIQFVLGVIFIMLNIDQNKSIYYHLKTPALS